MKLMIGSCLWRRSYVGAALFAATTLITLASRADDNQELTPELAFAKASALAGTEVTWNATFMPTGTVGKCMRFFFKGAPRAFDMCASTNAFWKEHPQRPHARVKVTGRLLKDRDDGGHRARFELMNIAPLPPEPGDALNLTFPDMRRREVEQYHGKKVAVKGEVKYPQLVRMPDKTIRQDIRVQVGAAKNEVVQVVVYGHAEEFKWNQQFNATPAFDGVETCVGEVCGVLFTLDESGK